MLEEANAIADTPLGPHPTKVKKRSTKVDAKYPPLETAFGRLRAYVGKVKCYIRLIPEGEEKKEQCLWGYQGS